MGRQGLVGGWAVIIVAVGAVPVRAAEVVFRDDFESAELAAGWEFVREDPAAHSLTERPGFMRIKSQRGAFTEGQPVQNLLVRSQTGDFILETRLEFDPQRAQEFAGLLVYQDDDNALALGLAYAEGERGVFRGIGMVGVSDGQISRRPGGFYDANTVEDPNVVYLRLLRSGDQFVAGYSPDGVTYTDIGSLTVSLPAAVRVGLGTTNGDFEGCDADCDVSIPADFDYVQISTFGDDDPSGGVTLESLTIDGPSEVVGGETASYEATAEFSDGTTLDVTADTEWTAAPAQSGTIEAGELQTEQVEATAQATIVATYTHLTSGGAVTRTDAVVVRITAPTSPAAPRGCGVGLLGVLLLVGPCWLCSRLRGARSRYRRSRSTPVTVRTPRV